MKRDKKLVIICLITSALAIIFLISTIVLASKQGDVNYVSSLHPTDVCKTTVCLQDALSIKTNMDDHIDPCKDFYSFACGGFYSTHDEDTGTDDIALLNIISKTIGLLQTTDLEVETNYATRTAIQLYRKCVTEEFGDQDGINAVLSMILEILGTSWPMAIGSTWNRNAFDMERSLAKFLKLNMGYLFQFEVITNFQNSAELVLWINTGKLWKKSNNVDLIVCTLIPNCSEVDTRSMDIAFLNVLSTNQQDNKNNLLEAITKRSANKEFQDMQMYKIAELREAIPEFDWAHFFGTFFERTGYKITNKFKVYMTSKFLELITVFTQHPRALANAMAWSVVNAWGPLYSPLLNKLLDSESTRRGICFMFVNNYFGFAVGKLFVNKYVSTSTLSEINEETQNLKHAVRKLLKNASWVDTATKKEALLKVDNLQSSVAAPQWALNDKSLASYYNKIGNVEDKSFSNVSRLAVFNFVVQKLQNLKKPLYKPDFWPTSSAIDLNAFYFPGTNTMHIQLGLTQSPFYVHGRPRALKFGYFGFVLGHEITHGFDTTGKDFDKNGNLNNWWNEETLKDFKRKQDCFRVQYSAIPDEVTGLYLNGTATLPDNIADNVGIRAAYQAFKDSPEEIRSKLVGLEEYTEEQIFFIASAQMWCSRKSMKTSFEDIKGTHSPDKYRVLVPLQNFEEFSKVFKCPLGSKMNPVRKCKIW